VLDRAHAALLAGGFHVDRLDGETPPLARARVIARFQDAPGGEGEGGEGGGERRVALVSVTAGGQVPIFSLDLHPGT